MSSKTIYFFLWHWKNKLVFLSVNLQSLTPLLYVGQVFFIEIGEKVWLLKQWTNEFCYASYEAVYFAAFSSKSLDWGRTPVISKIFIFCTISSDFTKKKLSKAITRSTLKRRQLSSSSSARWQFALTKRHFVANWKLAACLPKCWIVANGADSVCFTVLFGAQ